MVSNGITTVAESSDGKRKTSRKFDTPETLRSNIVGMAVRFGPHFETIAGNAGSLKDLDLEKAFTLSDFEMGGSEEIGGSEAQVVKFKVNVRRSRTSMDATVWIDAETGLPLKTLVSRKVKSRNQSYELDHIGTFSGMKLDEKIDGDSFELPE